MLFGPIVTVTNWEHWQESGQVAFRHPAIS